MAHHHSLLETFPVQFLCWEAFPHVQEIPVFVYNGRFSIKHIGQFSIFQRIHHALQSIVIVKLVACIQETEIIARCQTDAFVHGIVQSFIGFTDDAMYSLFVSIGYLEGIVL